MLRDTTSANRLNFTAGCETLDFSSYGDVMIAQSKVYGTLINHTIEAYDGVRGKGQVHVTSHFPQKVPGPAAFDLLAELQGEPEAFGFAVDPADGDVCIVSELESDTAEELERIVQAQLDFAERNVLFLAYYEGLARERGYFDDNPYSVKHFLNSLFLDSDE